MKQLEGTLGFILNVTGRNVSGAVDQALKPYAITHEQWAVIHFLHLEDGVTQRHLAERSKKDQPNITRILDLVEKKGFVQRVKKKEDRRSYLIFLTKEGKQLYKTLLPIVNQIFEKAMKDFSTEEEQLLRNLLYRINENLN